MKTPARQRISSMKMTASRIATGIAMRTREVFLRRDAMAAPEVPNASPICPLMVSEVGRQAVLAAR